MDNEKLALELDAIEENFDTLDKQELKKFLMDKKHSILDILPDDLYEQSLQGMRLKFAVELTHNLSRIVNLLKRL